LVVNGAHRCAPRDEKPGVAPDATAHTAICRTLFSASPVVGTSRPPTACRLGNSAPASGGWAPAHPARWQNRSRLAFVRAGGDTWHAGSADV